MTPPEELNPPSPSWPQTEHAHTELDRRVFHLKTLYDVSKDIFGAVEFETILQNFLLMTMGNFGVMEGFILTLDRPSTGIVHFVSMGVAEEEQPTLKDWAKKIILDGNGAGLSGDRPEPAAAHGETVPIAYGLPFEIEADHVGLLGLGHKLSEDPFHEDDKELLLTLINSLTVALKNALSRDQSNFYLRAAALKVTLNIHGYEGPIIAYSPKMRKVKEEIAALSKKRGPVLISGAQGTGKVYTAVKIHEGGSKNGAPFIVIDCRNLVEGEAREFLFGSSRFLEDRDDHSGFESLRHIGAIQLANQGTLVLRHIEALPLAAQEDLARYLKILLDGSILYPNVRVIATSREDGKKLSAENGLFPALAEQLSSSVVSLPTLRDRRKDILPLSNLFLQEKDGEQKLRISPGAEHVLVSRRFSHRNVSELREAVLMAALFSSDQEILAEHIFTGPKEAGIPLEYDLGQFPLVKRLVSDRVLAGVRVGVFSAFSLIILVSLTLSRNQMGHIANSLIWGLWWPMLIIILLFVGRLWCTVCPLATAGRFFSRFKKLKRPPPDWLKNYSDWLIPVGFSLIVWFEHFFSMTHYPAASGILLLSLMTGAVVFSVAFERESWCRYLCPLGNLGAIYSIPAPLSVRANPDVCGTICTTHQCHKGSETHAPCPVFHHPLFARDGHVCKLCFNCLKSCPNGSAKLYLRPPLLRIWRQADMGSSLSFFALFIFFIAPVMLASQKIDWISGKVGFTVCIFLAFALSMGLRSALPRLLSTEPDPDPAMNSRVAFALLVLAWGPVAAFHLANSPFLNSLTLSAVMGSFWADLIPQRDIPFIVLLQLGVVFIASGFMGISLWGIRSQLEQEGVPLTRNGWKILVALAAFYLGAVVALVLHKNVHT